MSAVIDKLKWSSLIAAVFTVFLFCLHKCHTEGKDSVTICSKVQSSNDDGTVKSIEVILRNESCCPLTVCLNPLYFDGVILILKNEENVLTVQDSKRYLAIRSGPMPMDDILLKSGDIYKWVIDSEDFVGADGKTSKIYFKDIKGIIAVSETIWNGKDGESRDPVIVLSRLK